MGGVDFTAQVAIAQSTPFMVFCPSWPIDAQFGLMGGVERIRQA